MRVDVAEASALAKRHPWRILGPNLLPLEPSHGSPLLCMTAKFSLFCAPVITILSLTFPLPGLQLRLLPLSSG